MRRGHRPPCAVQPGLGSLSDILPVAFMQGNRLKKEGGGRPKLPGFGIRRMCFQEGSTSATSREKRVEEMRESSTFRPASHHPRAPDPRGEKVHRRTREKAAGKIWKNENRKYWEKKRAVSSWGSQYWGPISKRRSASQIFWTRGQQRCDQIN